jgi:hypothetical protein
MSCGTNAVYANFGSHYVVTDSHVAGAPLTANLSCSICVRGGSSDAAFGQKCIDGERAQSYYSDPWPVGVAACIANNPMLDWDDCLLGVVTIICRQ